jgi:hypothetical protein
MSETKHILILANSAKHYPCTCVAGFEIISSGDENLIGGWIRPISTHDEGGLYPSEIRLKQGRSPLPFDFVEVVLKSKAQDALQPENWYIDDMVQWKTVNSKYERPDLDDLVQSPKKLWFEPGQPTDRVTSQALRKSPPKRSLYLIRLEEIAVEFGWYVREGRYKQRRRAIFAYKGDQYDLSITDPVFLDAYRGRFPEQGKAANRFKIRPKNGCYLCVSLAPEYKGYHYKVVATIIEAQ